jgi:glycerophosphoryl diester phosphodiesterase
MVADVPINPIEMAKEAQADYIHLCWEGRAAHPYELVTTEYVSKIQEAGFGVIIWHEEHLVPMRHLFAIGIDGICSNKPDVIARELAREPFH